MRRLTALDRTKILKLAMKHAFGKEEEGLADAENRLVLDLYEKRFGKATMDKVYSIAADWSSWESKEHIFRVEGLHFNLKTKEQHPRPGSNNYMLVKGEEFRERCETITKDKQTLASRKREAEAALMALLGSVTTLKRLQEVWPDGKEMYAFIKEDQPTLPAVQDLSALNALLRLP